MTDQMRRELFAVLSELSRRYPHWRIGQLIANVAGWADADIWDVEDEQLLSAAQAHMDTSAIAAGAEGTPNREQSQPT